MRYKFVFIVLLCGLALIACTSSEVKEKQQQTNYEKQKASLAEQEKENPVAFIVVNSRDKKNIIGQTVVRVKLESKAAVAVYQDIEMQLSFYSKTGTLLEKDTEIAYEVLEPGKTIDFKTKYFAPKGTDSIALKVIAAKVKAN
jgi:hypothetical protein